MNFFVLICISLGFTQLSEARFILENYNASRNQLIQEEIISSVGGKIILTEYEEQANKVIMHWKRMEVDESFNNIRYYNFSKHYFAYKNDIWKSKVYQIIRKMPKGGALHIHNSMMLDPDTVMSFTYEDYLYACPDKGYMTFHFSQKVPEKPCASKWSLMSELRAQTENVTIFDERLRKQFTLYTNFTEEQYENPDHIWERFNRVYKSNKGLIGYRPVREKYIYAALNNFYKDNVIYMEIRSGLHSLYELNGTFHDNTYLVHLYKQVTQKFIEDHPDFVGIKLILNIYRKKDINAIKESLELANVLKKEMPEMFAGYDLVGQEDLGYPLLQYLPALIKHKEDLQFYLHSGETNWYGTSSDENLFDAILLGARRLGHAYALTKHPRLIKAVMENDIAIEVNLVSNVVLSLVRDVRNHPLATFLALGLPVVISSDDPGAWEADPLSHDFYIAFVGVASKHADLRLLKQLALNSIKYSALDDAGKERTFKTFNKRWDEFIKDIIINFSN